MMATAYAGAFDLYHVVLLDLQQFEEASLHRLNPDHS